MSKKKSRKRISPEEIGALKVSGKGKVAHNSPLHLSLPQFLPPIQLEPSDGSQKNKAQDKTSLRPNKPLSLNTPQTQPTPQIRHNGSRCCMFLIKNQNRFAVPPKGSCLAGSFFPVLHVFSQSMDWKMKNEGMKEKPANMSSNWDST